MPTETQLAKPFSILRQGWLLLLGLVGLSTLRRWLLRNYTERRPLSTSRQQQRGGPQQRERRPRHENEGRGSYATAGNQGKGGSGASHATSGNQAKGSGGKGSRHKEAESPPLSGASEAEIGEQWHFEGRRRWAWLHDGIKQNGWIEFCAEGILRTSLCDGGRGTWESRAKGEMLVTFGKCHHILGLLPELPGQVPTFDLIERVMKDGSPLRSKGRGPPTKGRLDMES